MNLRAKLSFLYTKSTQIFWWLPILVMTSDFEEIEGIKMKTQGVYANTETTSAYLQIL